MTAEHSRHRADRPKSQSDRATRFSAELFEAAQSVGAQENRSARQQLEYWAGIGRSFTAQSSASRTRVEAALSGRIGRQALTAEEAVAFDAELPTRIDESMAKSDIIAERAADGFSSVYLDDSGQIVEIHPDGTTTVLDKIP